MATTRPVVVVLAARTADLADHLEALNVAIDRRQRLVVAIADAGRDVAHWVAVAKEAGEDLLTAPKGVAKEKAAKGLEAAWLAEGNAKAALASAKRDLETFDLQPQAGAVVGAMLRAAERACAIEFAAADAAFDREADRARREMFKAEGESCRLNRQAERLERPIRPGEPGSGIKGGKIRTARADQARALRNEADTTYRWARDLEEVAYAAK